MTQGVCDYQHLVLWYFKVECNCYDTIALGGDITESKATGD